ncbi:hypothetical protein LSAT2_011473 [Lamellibrachia satsuma]|nr:hypothetical protein LSAT2_011473 [Lamellibrachia satsuma]
MVQRLFAAGVSHPPTSANRWASRALLRMEKVHKRTDRDERSLCITTRRTKTTFVFSIISLNIIICACGVATIIISTTYAGLVGGGEHVVVFSRLPTERGQRIDEAVLAWSLLERAPVYVASVGAISAVLGFYGVVIFLRHSVAYLLCYFLSMSVLLLVQSTLAISYMVYLDLLNNSLASFMQQTIRQGYREGSIYQQNGINRPPTSRIDIAWDHTMLKFSCCGSEDIHDFEKNATHWIKVYRLHYQRVPLMCCSVVPASALTLQTARFVDAENCIHHMSVGGTNLQVCYPSVRRQLIDCTKVIILLLVSLLPAEMFVTCQAIWFAHIIYKQCDARRGDRKEIMSDAQVDPHLLAAALDGKQTPSLLSRDSSLTIRRSPVMTGSCTTPSLNVSRKS